MADFEADGVVVFDADPHVAGWARAALPLGIEASQDLALRDAWLRHGGTWFVGVDALANGPDGAVGGVALRGGWEDLVPRPKAWHRAQVSVVYEGFPKRDAGETEAAHAFRINRCGAHMDGLHLERGRRIMREPHAFILGLPLNHSSACPLVVWRGSHVVMRAALGAAIGEREVIGAGDPIGADVTEAYKAARARVFERCAPVEIVMEPGQAVLLDRFAVHGVAPWRDGDSAPVEGRMVAYFRPQFEDAQDWLLG